MRDQINILRKLFHKTGTIANRGTDLIKTKGKINKMFYAAFDIEDERASYN